MRRNFNVPRQLLTTLHLRIMRGLPSFFHPLVPGYCKVIRITKDSKTMHVNLNGGPNKNSPWKNYRPQKHCNCFHYYTDMCSLSVVTDLTVADIVEVETCVKITLHCLILGRVYIFNTPYSCNWEIGLQRYSYLSAWREIPYIHNYTRHPRETMAKKARGSFHNPKRHKLHHINWYIHYYYYVCAHHSAV